MQPKDKDLDLTTFDNPGRWTIDNSESRFSPRIISSPARRSILKMTTPNRYASPIAHGRFYSLAQKRARRVSFAPRNDIRFMDKDDSYNFDAFSEAANLIDEEEPTVFSEAMATPTDLLSKLPSINMSRPRPLRLPPRSPGSPSVRRQSSLLSFNKTRLSKESHDNMRGDSPLRRPSLSQQFESSMMHNINEQPYKKMDIHTLFADEDDEEDMEEEEKKEEEERPKRIQQQEQRQERHQEETQDFQQRQHTEEQLSQSGSPFNYQNRANTGASPIYIDSSKNTPKTPARSPIPIKDRRPIQIRSEAVNNPFSSPDQPESTDSDIFVSRADKGYNVGNKVDESLDNHDDSNGFDFKKRLAVYQNYIPSSPSAIGSPTYTKPFSTAKSPRSPFSKSPLARSPHTSSPLRSPIKSPIISPNNIRSPLSMTRHPKSPLATSALKRTLVPTRVTKPLSRSPRTALSPRFERYVTTSNADNNDKSSEVEITGGVERTHLEKKKIPPQTQQKPQLSVNPFSSLDKESDDEHSIDMMLTGDNIVNYTERTAELQQPQQLQMQQSDKSPKAALSPRYAPYEKVINIDDEDDDDGSSAMMITDDDLSVQVQNSAITVQEHQQSRILTTPLDSFEPLYGHRNNADDSTERMITDDEMNMQVETPAVPQQRGQQQQPQHSEQLPISELSFRGFEPLHRIRDDDESSEMMITDNNVSTNVKGVSILDHGKEKARQAASHKPSYRGFEPFDPSHDHDDDNDSIAMMLTDNGIGTQIQRATLFKPELPGQQLQRALDTLSPSGNNLDSPRRRLRHSFNNLENSITSMTSDLFDFNLGDEPALNDITLNISDETPYRTPPIDYEPSPYSFTTNTMATAPISTPQRQQQQQYTPTQYTPLPPAPSYQPTQDNTAKQMNDSIRRTSAAAAFTEVENDSSNSISIKQFLTYTGITLPEEKPIGEDTLEKYAKLLDDLSNNNESSKSKSARHLQPSEQIVALRLMKPAIDIVKEVIQTGNWLLF
ncbi:hypothetical protein BDF20DRAFT_30544 [Mycotypha africana]|uniref:uncharacterized protein n=1 Tax=Mycotypha africana TaxID=64632 RepID=UPI002301BDDD|nr:uncharacterized protein BDF20DRAFT_30544 [Mycotypha africana]KAI8991226.1 hypothetical protein BDF20DRAFT_30544 [Mycotypha africana]